LIEASFAAQYGVRLSSPSERNITFGEFYRLLKGVMPDTPLGVVVAARAEKDPERLRRLSPAEKRLRADWTRFLNRLPDKRGDAGELQKNLARLFGPAENARKIP
jgi:hypothetical protein